MELEHRVIKLELRQDSHTEELRTMRAISVDFKESLDSIKGSLAQIKWISTGAVLAVVAQSIGIDKILLKIFTV